MKRIKKLIAVLLCAALMAGISVPLASAQGDIPEVTDVVQEIPETDGQPVEEETTETEEDVQEKDYFEKVGKVFEEGLVNLERGGLTLCSFFVSPLVILFPMTTPVGLILLVTGLPTGIGRLLLGFVEIIGSPLIALF